MSDWLASLDMSDILLNSLLALIALVVFVSAWRFHQDPKYKKFNLFSLVTHRDGTLSRPAVQEIGAFILTSWAFILLINKGLLAEWFLIPYLAAWVGRSGFSAWLQSRGGK